MSDDRYLDAAAETMPRAALEALHDERVATLAGYWYERSDLVRAAWDAAGVRPSDVTGLDAFRERVPFVDKDAIRAHRDRTSDPYGGVLCVDEAELTAVFSSSGTTGDATFFAERWATGWSHLAIGRARALWGMGVRPGDVVVVSPPATFRGPAHELAATCGAVPLVVDCWLGRWGRVLAAFRRHRPAYMALSKPQLIDLAHHAGGTGDDVREAFSSFRAVGFAGEPLGRRLRQRMEDEWGMEVYLWTSAGDLGFSFECNTHDGCHIWEDSVLVECLDPEDGTPMPDGEVGELVVTAIDDPVAPLVRYRTDDLVRVTKEPCGCGRTHARQWPLGRKGDEVVVQGRSVLPLDVWSALEAEPETQDGVFQLIRPARQVDELRIRIGYRAEATGDVGDLAERLEAAVSAAVGIRPVLELQDQAELLAQAPAATKTMPRVAVR